MQRWKREALMILAVAGVLMSIHRFGIGRTRDWDPPPAYRSAAVQYGGPPLEIVGHHAHRPAHGRRPETASELHVLVVMAGDSVAERGGAMHDYEWGVRATNVWRVLGPLRGGRSVDRTYQLDYVFVPTRHAATVAGRRFDLTRGNLFVVHLGQDARPRVTQIEGPFLSSGSSSDTYYALADRFVAALARDDPARPFLAPNRESADAAGPCPPNAPRRRDGKSGASQAQAALHPPPQIA